VASGPGNFDEGGEEDEVSDSSAFDSDSPIPEDEVNTMPTGDARVDLSSFVRIANWVAGSPSGGYDVCLSDREAGSRFVGPLVAQAWTAIDAGDAGDAAVATLSFPSVTSYLTVAPGDYVVRLVAFGSDCTTGVLADFTAVPPLSPHAYSTLAMIGTAVGDGGAPHMRIEVYEDDQAVAGFAAVRFVQAVPGLSAVKFGLVGSFSGPADAGGGTFLPLATDVAYGSTSLPPGGDAGTIDNNGYLLTAPWTGVLLEARTMGAAAVARGEDSVAYEDAVTVALIGASTGAQLFQCFDNGYAGPLLSQCKILASASTSAGPSGDGG
jgi:hypothetical protein